MKILDLSLTYHWFDEILSGRKKEEYREPNPFNQKRILMNPSTNGKIPDIAYFKHYDAVRFHRGQGSPMTMLVECKSIYRGHGKAEWGAPDHEVFIICLGQILSKPDDL